MKCAYYIKIIRLKKIFCNPQDVYNKTFIINRVDIINNLIQVKNAMNISKKVIIAGLAFAIPMLVSAAVSKYTFNDVAIDGQVVEIEATVKQNKRTDVARCDYYADDYAEWLGYYEEAVSISMDSNNVEAFCADHFVDRVQG